MGELIIEPPLSEPLVVPCLFITGMAIEPSDYVIRLVGWVQLPMLGGEADERRIVIRFVMPIDAARGLRNGLTKVFRKSDN